MPPQSAPKPSGPNLYVGSRRRPSAPNVAAAAAAAAAVAVHGSSSGGGGGGGDSAITTLLFQILTDTAVSVEAAARVLRGGTRCLGTLRAPGAGDRCVGVCELEASIDCLPPD